MYFLKVSFTFKPLLKKYPSTYVDLTALRFVLISLHLPIQLSLLCHDKTGAACCTQQTHVLGLVTSFFTSYLVCVI